MWLLCALGSGVPVGVFVGIQFWSCGPYFRAGTNPGGSDQFYRGKFGITGVSLGAPLETKFHQSY